MLKSPIVYIGMAAGIFGAALLVDHFAFADTAWGIYNPGWTIRLYSDPDYITCTHSSHHTLVAERPVILKITPIIGTGLALLGTALVLFGQLPIPKKQVH